MADTSLQQVTRQPARLIKLIGQQSSDKYGYDYYLRIAFFDNGDCVVTQNDGDMAYVGARERNQETHVGFPAEAFKKRFKYTIWNLGRTSTYVAAHKALCSPCAGKLYPIGSRFTQDPFRTPWFTRGAGDSVTYPDHAERVSSVKSYLVEWEDNYEFSDAGQRAAHNALRACFQWFMYYQRTRGVFQIADNGERIAGFLFGHGL